MRLGALITVLALVNLAALFGSFLIGRYSIAPSTLADFVWQSTFGGGWQGSSQIAHVIVEIRLPRLLAAVLIGAALSVAGAVYQGMFRNPLVSPDVLGATSGASFGASLAIILGFSVVGLQSAAFLFGLLAVVGAWWISSLSKRDQILTLVLGGIIISALFSAGTSMLKYVADPNSELPAITFWLMGGINGVRRVDLMPLAIPVVACTLILWLMRWRLDVISFGSETATALGVNVPLTRAVVVICATVLTGVSVAVGGVIGWIGLIIPHLTRMAFGPDHRVLIPVSALLGSLFLLGVDTLSRTLFTMEIPLGILTAIIGAPFLAILLIRNKSW